MKTIYVVDGRVAYEGHYTIRAFASRNDAYKFLAYCEKCRDDGEEFEYGHYDYFSVDELDFVDASQAT